jgi:hypothetical protein
MDSAFWTKAVLQVEEEESIEQKYISYFELVTTVYMVFISRYQPIDRAVGSDIGQFLVGVGKKSYVVHRNKRTLIFPSHQ